jgi:hypothetical protein
MKRIFGSRRHDYRARSGIFLLIMALLVGMAGYGGTCSVNPPPQEGEIRTWYDLDAVTDNLSGNYTLMNDLDSTTAGYDELAGPTANWGKGWEPISWQPIESWDTEGFNGTFDGQGYEIRDLFINRPDQDIIGLFCGVVGYIKDLGVVNAYVVGDLATGVLAGGNGGTITNSYATGTVAGNWSVGGLVGSNGGTVNYCYFNGSVTGYVYVGCLVGFNSYAVVSNSYSTGSATGTLGMVGGLVGINERGYVSNSYSVGSADGGAIIGGLVGANAGNVSESYSLASVTGNRSVGGLVGHNGWNVTNCYSAGSVAGNDNVGGLVGEGRYDNVTNSFWDTETSGQATSAGGVGKNTTEMQDINTFSGAGWDITTVINPSARNPAYIWNIVDDVTYPFLSWQP